MEVSSSIGIWPADGSALPSTLPIVERDTGSGTNTKTTGIFDFEPELNRRSGPWQDFDLVDLSLVVAEKYNEPQAIRKIGVAGQVSPGRRRRRGPNPFNQAKALDKARDEQILQKVISIEVNVRPDLMGRKIPGLIRQMDPDIPTQTRLSPIVNGASQSRR